MLSGSMSSRTKHLISSSVNSSGWVFVMPSFCTEQNENKQLVQLNRLDYANSSFMPEFGFRITGTECERHILEQMLRNSAVPSVLWRCWLGGRKGIRPVKTERWGAGMVICLEWGADLHMAQLMPLPLTVFCFTKIQFGFTFLVPAYLGSPGQRAVKRVCVCVCVVLTDMHRSGSL